MKFKFGPGSFALTGLVEAVALPYLGIQVQQLTLDEKAELLFLDQGYGSHFLSLLIL